MAPFHSSPPFFLAALLVALTPAFSVAQQSSFEIIKGGDVVGSVAASRTVSGDKTLYVLTSYSEMDILWKQVVSTVGTAEYLGNDLRACMTTIRLNGAMRDSSHMSSDGQGFRCHVHPDAPYRRTQTSAWTTARMYYEEPVGQQTIFVESVLTPCTLATISAGNYLLTFPNGSTSRYVYKAGQLEEIHVDRTFINLLFRRKRG